MNLAGISGALAPIHAHSPSNYAAVFAVNVEGTFNCMSAQLRNMRVARGNVPGGSIVNAASITGLVGKPNCSIYCASKHAVVGLTKAAAKEQAATGIRVNAIAPYVLFLFFLSSSSDQSRMEETTYTIPRTYVLVSRWMRSKQGAPLSKLKLTRISPAVASWIRRLCTLSTPNSDSRCQTMRCWGGGRVPRRWLG